VELDRPSEQTRTTNVSGLITSVNGLPLFLTSHGGLTRYRGVSQPMARAQYVRRFAAHYRDSKGVTTFLGYHSTAIKAAIAYARHAASRTPPTPRQPQRQLTGEPVGEDSGASSRTATNVHSRPAEATPAAKRPRTAPDTASSASPACPTPAGASAASERAAVQTAATAAAVSAAARQAASAAEAASIAAAEAANTATAASSAARPEGAPELAGGGAAAAPSLAPHRQSSSPPRGTAAAASSIHTPAAATYDTATVAGNGAAAAARNANATPSSFGTTPPLASVTPQPPGNGGGSLARALVLHPSPPQPFSSPPTIRSTTLASFPHKLPFSHLGGSSAVAAFLEVLRLGAYAPMFEAHGYDDLEYLLCMSDVRVFELADEMGMKRGHAKKFVDWRVTRLVCTESADGGGA